MTIDDEDSLASCIAIILVIGFAVAVGVLGWVV